MTFKSVADTAERWGKSQQLVRRLCLEGRIPGAMMVGRDWLIPADATHPERKTRTPKPKNAVRRLKE